MLLYYASRRSLLNTFQDEPVTKKKKTDVEIEKQNNSLSGSKQQNNPPFGSNQQNNPHSGRNDQNNKDYYEVDPEERGCSLYVNPKFAEFQMAKWFGVLEVGEVTKLPWNDSRSGQFYIKFAR